MSAALVEGSSRKNASETGCNANLSSVPGKDERFVSKALASLSRDSGDGGGDRDGDGEGSNLPSSGACGSKEA